MRDFVLKDHLRHRAYNWPETVLTYRETGAAPDPDSDALLMDGVPVPYEVKAAPGGYELKVSADLPCGGEHVFSWGKGRPFPPLGSDNGRLAVCFSDAPGGLVTVTAAAGGTFFYTLETGLEPTAQRERMYGGAVETVFEKTLDYPEGRQYVFRARLKRNLDYIEVEETMRGWYRDEARLTVTWRGFGPRYRHTLDRGEEKIDAYTDARGALPFVINPLMPRRSAWDQRYVSYIDRARGVWSGLLLHDLTKYDDDMYAIWGSRDRLAFDLYPDRWCGRTDRGTRAFLHVIDAKRPPEALGEHYLRWYGHVPLDAVKDWVLDWPDDKSEYPKYYRTDADTEWGSFYFERLGMPSPEDMMNIIDRDATIFARPDLIAPVSCRAYRSSWAQTFDLTASRMTDEQFARARAALALVCYLCASENYYPIDGLLSGHPNFLTDVLGTFGVFAALLGRRHPMFDAWMARYEKGIARNFKYHIRPAVEEWAASGGRWTENVGCYMMGMLQCVAADCAVIRALSGGEIPFLYPHIRAFADFLVQILRPENEAGRRLYGPHGAHAATGEFGGKFGHGFCLGMIQFADMLRYYDPLASEYLSYNFRRPADFAGVLESAGISGRSYAPHTENLGGTPPALGSRKFTGFGYVLRSRPNTDDEMCVILQQIDEGPNYRWGRAADGGCGELYYLAGHKSYTDHAPEAVGDENTGDVQACTNFGVLVGHEYKSVGRSELTEPLMDFGFVQYARVNAGPHGAPHYRYRSVMMVENRYIAVYDAVADAFQYGRFVWAQNAKDDFPVIWNLRPGVVPYETTDTAPVDRPPEYRYKGAGRQRVFDGQGDFFTIVTHLRDYNDERLIYGADKKEYGAAVRFPQHTEYVFCDAARCAADEDGVAFDGYVGYAAETYGETRLAIFSGRFVSAGRLSLRIPYEENVRRGMSAVLTAGTVCGRAVFGAAGEAHVACDGLSGRVWIDGAPAPFRIEDGAYVFTVPEGFHGWTIGERPDIGRVAVTGAVTRGDGFTVHWAAEPGADAYEVELSADAYEYVPAGRTGETALDVQAKPGKYYVRVRGVRTGSAGGYGHPYPVYVTADRPHPPEGLRVVREREGFRATWGEVLGAGTYRLYRKTARGCSLVYEGAERSCPVPRGTYCVAAVNGNGEGAKSLTRSTDGELAAWDNHPEYGFVRDTRSFEHGYRGFDYIENRIKGVLSYPEKYPED